MNAVEERRGTDQDLRRILEERAPRYFGVDRDPRDTSFGLIHALSAEVGREFAELFTITTLLTFTDIDGGACQQSSEEVVEQRRVMFDTDRLRPALDFDFEQAVNAGEEIFCTRRVRLRHRASGDPPRTRVRVAAHPNNRA
jgi:hypothetical protein